MRKTAKVKPCVTCGKPFEAPLSSFARGRKVCSWECHRQLVGVRPAFVTMPCLQCGTPFRRTQAAIKRTKHSFCGYACFNAWRVRENHSSWRGGHTSYRGPGWPKRAAEIRERDGYRCRRCGKHQDDEKRRLSVDHVIPFRSFTDIVEANDPSNLVALCHSCHAKKHRAEQLWLKGDVLDMWRYQIAVSQPWGETA